MNFLRVNIESSDDTDSSDVEDVEEKVPLPKLSDMMSSEIRKSFETVTKNCDQEQKKIDEEIAEVGKRIVKLLTERDLISKKIKPSTKVLKEWIKLCISVNPSISGTLSFEMYYMIPDCTWRPNYELRVQTTSTTNKLTLYYFAEVHQETGEDWKDIPVKLSSVDTALGLTPLPLEEKYTFFSTAPPGFFGSLFGSILRRDDMDFGTDPEVSTKKSKGVSICTFDLNVKNIPSDKAFHKMILMKMDLNCDLTHYCIPSKDLNVYLQLVATNTSKFAILKGPMDVFLDDNYVSKSNLNDINPNEQFTCYLGIDPTVKVKYAVPQRFSSSSGFFSSSVKTLVKRSITIKNTKQTKIRLLLKDQLPRALNNTIHVTCVHPKMSEKKHVELVYNKQPVTAHLTEENTVEWNCREIQAGIEMIIQFEYFIEYPGGKRLNMYDF